MEIKEHQVVIVGGGLAGVVSAIELAKNNFDVALISDEDYQQSASYYAQGGIAAQINVNDTPENHIDDTLIASANIADIKSVSHVVENSRNAIHWLEENGVVFDKDDTGEYSLHLEGGHSLQRILHIKDHTGKAIIDSLYNTLNKYENIKIYNHCKVFKLIKDNQNNRCIGLYSYIGSNEIVAFKSSNIILATGGAAGIYKYATKTNPSTGTGMVMAYDIGCELENLEFMQFHPTCFFDKNHEPLLISEAVRGSGAILQRECGLAVMREVHPQKDLAPRDIVARQIYANMQRGHDVFLNATHLSGSQWQDKFPSIYKKLLENGIDPTNQPIPISPAAHYSCGGIKVDLRSQTKVTGLYAVGEVSCTGLHGSNRLASNSLLECLVYGLSAAKDICVKDQQNIDHDIKALKAFKSDVDIKEYTAVIKQLMWDNVGLVRNANKLKQAKEKLREICATLPPEIVSDKYDLNLEKVKKLMLLAELTIDNAILRKQSVGSHFIEDK
ncbi:UNVERIFIED_CONTAM: hypothetical protein GTU68_008945 [Idotea baltica]|nr:hypothetical protein [Idotea baltica]